MKIIVIVPRREEFLACEVLKGLFRKGIELITTEPLVHIRNAYANCSPVNIGAGDIPIGKHHSDEEILEHAKTADYIFVLGSKFASPNETNFGSRLYLLDKINRPEITVFIDGS